MEFAMLKNKDNRYIKSLIINGTNVLLRLSITYKKVFLVVLSFCTRGVLSSAFVNCIGM